MSNINVSLTNRRPQILITQNESIVKRLNDILDVDADNPQDGAILMFNSITERFETSLIISNQNIDGGTY